MEVVHVCWLALCELELDESLLAACLPMAVHVLKLKCPRQLFRTKRGSIVENWDEIAILKSVGRNPFARNELRSPKTEVKVSVCKSFFV